MAASRRNSSMAVSKRSSHFTGASASRIASSVRLGITASKKDMHKNTKNNPKEVRVIDEGMDVTPRSLLTSTMKAPYDIEKGDSKSSLHANFNFNDSRAFGPPPELCQSQAVNSSMVQASQMTGLNKSIMSSMISSASYSRVSLESVTSAIMANGNAETAFGGEDDEIGSHLDEKEPLTTADLKKTVYITLSETDTIPLFEMIQISVCNSDDDAEIIKERNDKYDKLCSIREGNDTYRARGMQTFNDALKAKEMQTVTVEHHDIGVSATSYDLFDTYYNVKDITQIEEEQEEQEGLGVVADLQKNHGSSSVEQSCVEQSRVKAIGSIDDIALSKSNLITPQCSGSPLPPKFGSKMEISEAELEKFANSESMKENLFIMERTVVQNIYHPKQFLYRGLDEREFSVYGRVKKLCHLMQPKDISSMRPNVSRLWAYECASTRGLAVTCMTWNKINTDILAVGYSENNTTSVGKGLVCIWSIKNPEHPERLYVPTHAVTAVDFSENRPNVLAVGLYDGSIHLYNIQSVVPSFVLDSTESVGKHTGPVWELKWVPRDSSGEESREEILVSASGDGRITQWTIIKGFEFCDLMKVKRAFVKGKPQKKQGGAKKSDAFISRFAPALCFDFHPNDGNLYLIGSEDLCIHRCSCSYNEQFLETYTGHKGPVYKVAWSPFDEKVFLSSSADWSIRLWHVDRTEPIFVFQVSTKAVVDIDWSPISSTVFTAISENQIEIWDLNESILDPIVIHSPVNKTALTSVKFALNAEVLLVGDCEGYTTVYQLSEFYIADHTSYRKNVKLSKIVESTMPELKSFCNGEKPAK